MSQQQKAYNKPLDLLMKIIKIIVKSTKNSLDRTYFLYMYKMGKHPPQLILFDKLYLHFSIWKLKSNAGALLQQPYSLCYDECNHRVPEA